MQKLEITVHTKYARHAPLDVGLICPPIFGGIRTVMIFAIGFQTYGGNGPKKRRKNSMITMFIIDNFFPIWVRYPQLTGITAYGGLKTCEAHLTTPWWNKFKQWGTGR